jgi:2-polyprenyl-6-methoxyphenol hydroxylase-like FAD-dependent oxidoreductase
VVADGAHSALRGRVMPQARAPVYPWGCIWATVQDATGLGAARMLQQRFAGTTRMMGILPVAANCVTMFWSLPAEDLVPDRPLDLEKVREQALALWPEASPVIERAVDAGDFSRATYRRVALPHWNDGPVLFVGDAAHGTSPQLGQGANLGLCDAHALGRALGEASDLGEALAVFARRRDSASRFYRTASNLLTPFFQSDGVVLGIVRDLTIRHACYAPILRSMMTSTLAGLRCGWFSADALDADGRYSL